MILSASRRTDIPAFYSEWFMNRIRDGYLLSRNPLYPEKTYRRLLTPDEIDFIVFWTKDPTPMLPYIKELDDHYKFYFHFTLNPYQESIEPMVSKKGPLIDTFKKLSDMIGPERVLWRYDPIILTEKISIDFHEKAFGHLADILSSYTDCCTVSFLDTYQKLDQNLKTLGLRSPTRSEREQIGNILKSIADDKGLEIRTCAEELYSIPKGKCVDDERIFRITGKKVSKAKDKAQRLNCGCIKSIDIGEYDTCTHGCKYCYANLKLLSGDKEINHFVDSPFLVGK